MRRFSLIGALGPDDDLEASKILQGDSTVIRVDLLDGKQHIGYGIGKAIDELAKFGLGVTEKAVDLVILAALVNAGDTRILRKDNSLDRWTREIDLYVPVSEPDQWSACRKHIELTLKFLTGDRWRVFFRSRTLRTKTLAYRPLPKKSIVGDMTGVSLLSGGLDSLIGAIDQLKAGKRPFFVSHWWGGQTSTSQRYVYENLKRYFGDSQINGIQVKLGFKKKILNLGDGESSQRGRSFLFYSIATLVASAFGRKTTINIPENGFIALNVPLDWLRLGALSTRTAHPHFLSCMGEIARKMGIAVTYSNPYRHNTKGEMVERCSDKEFLKKIVKNSMSCSAPDKLRFDEDSPKHGHCGYCVPCLIRRASLEFGLGASDPTEYIIDVLAQKLNSKSPKGRHVRSFQLIARKVENNPDLAKSLIFGTGPFQGEQNQINEYGNVCRRGVMEVGRFLRTAVAKPG